MTDLSKIIKLVETQRTILLAKGHIKDVLSRLAKARASFIRLETLLNEKYDSVESLKNKSIRHLFQTVLGNKEDQLEMRRQEYLQVVLQYHEARKSVDMLEFELEILKKQIEREAFVEQALEKAIQEHRAEILDSYPLLAEAIIIIEKEISNISANRKELEEAQFVGEQLLATLSIIIKNLERASDWGNWEDMKISRKLEVKAKNLFVDKAMTNVYVVQLLFERFAKELQDIHNHKEIQGSYHFHDFGNFTEVYYNRLIADWVIQQRIKDSKQNVEGVHSNTSMIVASLKHEIKQADLEIKARKNQIDNLIKGSLEEMI